jgi:hypothetical protein
VRNKENIQCRRCQGWGHFQWECPEQAAEGGGGNQARGARVGRDGSDRRMMAVNQDQGNGRGRGRGSAPSSVRRSRKYAVEHRLRGCVSAREGLHET